MLRHQACPEFIEGKHERKGLNALNEGVMLRHSKHERKGLNGFMLILCFFTLASFWSKTGAAQPQYDNTVYLPQIKTIQFYNIAQRDSFPIINLGSNDKISVAFDDLRGGSRNYYYSIEHCDANWNSSNLSTAEYLLNYNDDRITNYSYSLGTIRKYTHYELTFPNANIAPKIAGNYIFKVFEDEDQSKMIFTKRLYVLGTKVSIIAEIVPSNEVALRQTNQKINFTLNYGNLRVQNPATDFRTLIMQNGRSETGNFNTQPTYIRGPQLIYSEYNGNDFPGGNEFRHFDTRSLRLNSENIQRIYRDTANTVILLTDADKSRDGYIFNYDLDGKFFILNQDGSDPRTDADYAHMVFSLSTSKSPADGTPYIIGQFNDYKTDANSKLSFDAQSGRYLTSIFLKQGVYDYTYVWVDKAGKQDDYAFEGSHFETENNYQLLVYYRPPGARWEELVGYRILNSAKQ